MKVAMSFSSHFKLAVDNKVRKGSVQQYIGNIVCNIDEIVCSVNRSREITTRVAVIDDFI